MTHIVNYTTKKAFREDVERRPERVYVSDPAIINPVSGNIQSVVDQVGIVYVTNHPKRSWFANVRKDRNGKLKVA